MQRLPSPLLAARPPAPPAPQAGKLAAKGMKSQIRTWVRCYLLQLDDPYNASVMGRQQ
jgi:hypothetical protein